MCHLNSKWILHIIDHGSRFNLAFPLVKKGAHVVVRALENYAFPVMALASMLHSDNGRELVNFNDWTGQVQLVSERPCHPQS